MSTDLERALLAPTGYDDDGLRDLHDAAAALASRDATIADLRAERVDKADAWDAIAAKNQTIADLRARAEAAEARCAELEKALKPFGEYLDTAHFDLDNHGNPLPDDQGMGWVYLNIGDFRRARALSASSNREERE